ncbi:MAG: hypothetical protein IT438_04570 [Phycisphaerales bacterium]|nr:hypothetical protein [Phycisphaerales bacterium]
MRWIVGAASASILAVAPMAYSAPPSQAATACFRNMRTEMGEIEGRLRTELDDAAARAGMVLEIIAGFGPSESDLRSLWAAAMESINGKLDDGGARVESKSRTFARRLERRDAPPRLLRRADQVRRNVRTRLGEHAAMLKAEFESRMRELFPEVDVGAFGEDEGPR